MNPKLQFFDDHLLEANSIPMTKPQIGQDEDPQQSKANQQKGNCGKSQPEGRGVPGASQLKNTSLKYSQNFLIDDALVTQLLAKSDISAVDTVVEIGAGNGNITRQLSTKCKSVIAVELDAYLYNRLKQRLSPPNNSYNSPISSNRNVIIINDDILTYELPLEPYKVFSNLPFNITSQVIDKLYFQGTTPLSAYLIMQKEALNLLLGYPRETQRSLLLKPFFNIEIFHWFNRYDFKPVPAVNIGMLSIKKLISSKIEPREMHDYWDFIVFGTTQCKKTLKKSLEKLIPHWEFKKLALEDGFPIKAKPLDLTVEQWIYLYKYYVKNCPLYKKAMVKESYAKQRLVQAGFNKRHRTRTKLIG